MKLMMFAALAAAVAMPALAQTTPAPAADPAMAQPAPTAPPADPAMAQPAPPADPAQAAPMTPPPPPAPDSAAAPAAAPMPATGSYPKCSRTVTDQCTEASNAKGERMHSKARAHKR